jgi:hypothetical protein
MTLPEGICRVCGQWKPLTEEHVPPKATGNKGRYVLATFEQALDAGPNPIVGGIPQQGGIIFQTLCTECNTNYCNRYNNELIRWYDGGTRLLRQLEENAARFKANNIYPLRIMKGILSMFLAINPESFRFSAVGQQLAALILDKEAKGLPDGVKVYAYFNHTGHSRHIPFHGQWPFDENSTIEDLYRACKALDDYTEYLISEIAMPPYGYVMTINHDQPHERLCDISRFADFDFGARGTAELSLAVLPTHLRLMACDYRELYELSNEERESMESDSVMGIDPDVIRFV